MEMQMWLAISIIAPFRTRLYKQRPVTWASSSMRRTQSLVCTWKDELQEESIFLLLLLSFT